MGARPLTVAEVMDRLRLPYRQVRTLMEQPDDPLPSFVTAAGTVVIDRVEFARWVRRRARFGQDPGLVPTFTRHERVVLAALAATGTATAAAHVLSLSTDAVRASLERVRTKYAAVGVTVTIDPELIVRASADGVTVPLEEEGVAGAQYGRQQQTRGAYS